MSHARSELKDFKALAPDANDMILALSQAAGKAGIDKQLIELVKLRASQINGCAFCVQFHILQGESLGIAADKLNLIVVWREAPLFSARERAALAWTEALTLVTGGVSDEVYAQASVEFSERELGLSLLRDRLDQRLEPARRRLPLDPAGAVKALVRLRPDASGQEALD
jgi:AhpD family alkylhydroperoxidase